MPSVSDPAVAETPTEARTPAQRFYDRVAELADAVIAWPLQGLAEIGTLARLLFESVLWMIRPPYRMRLLIGAVEFIGWQSLVIVGLTGTFVGAALGLQLVEAFRRFGAEDQTGTVVGLALSRELAPVFSALMISSRAGSAIATEVGSMRVSNQIDALTTMSVSPVQYLISPRIAAAIFAVPVMALWFFVVGISGAYLVAVSVQGLDGGTFIERVKWFVDGRDIMQLFTKACVFGIAVTLIACRQGFYADGGAAGVGQATNKAVVHSAVAILALNFVVTSILCRRRFVSAALEQNSGQRFASAGKDPVQIQIVDLRKSYSGTGVLNGVTFDIHRGLINVIIGGSGAGKSVFTRQLLRLEHPDSGKIVVDGTDIVPLNDWQLLPIRKKFGMVFQFGALFDSMTCFDNVAFQLREHTKMSRTEVRDRVMQKLGELNVAHAAEKLPGRISGGMQKRVAIARALVLEPEVLVYDEPTSGLDPVSSRLVDDLIAETSSKFGVTSVVITHDMASVFKIAHRVNMLYKGRIEAACTPDEILKTTNTVVIDFLKASGVQVG